MTTEDYRELERLLGQLEVKLGHRYCIVPHSLHDGFNIAIYDDKGNLKKQDTWATIEGTVDRILGALAG